MRSGTGNASFLQVVGFAFGWANTNLAFSCMTSSDFHSRQNCRRAKKLKVGRCRQSGERIRKIVEFLSLQSRQKTNSRLYESCWQLKEPPQIYPKMPRLPRPKIYQVIRFAYHGCTNRPFFHIVLLTNKSDRQAPPIEQLGTYDPLPNIFNEKLVSLDIERIKLHLANGAAMSKPVEKLLGLSGLLPVHPMSYITAERNRKKNLNAEKEDNDESSGQS